MERHQWACGLRHSQRCAPRKGEMCSLVLTRHYLGFRGPWKKTRGTPHPQRSDLAEAAAFPVRSSAPEPEAWAAYPPSCRGGGRSGGWGRPYMPAAAGTSSAASEPSRGADEPSGSGVVRAVRWLGAGET